MKEHIFIMISIACALAGPAIGQVGDVSRDVGQWVDLHMIQHREQVEWLEQQHRLEQGIALLRKEKALLEQRLSIEQEQAEEWTGEELALAQKRTALEQSLQSASVQFQKEWPYLQRAAQHHNTVLKKTPNATLGDKAASVMEWALTLQREHQKVEVRSRLLDLPDGTQRQMDVLTLGHAQAFAVSSDRRAAARAVWNGEAWAWEWNTAWADRIQEAIRVQRGDLSPRWVVLPVVPDVQGEMR